MKFASGTTRIVAALAGLLVLTSASFAANTLSNPRGLAIDAMGNLWVANALGGAAQTGNIEVFDPSYVLQAAQTITQNIHYPSAVSFDPFGNLWVANFGMSNGGTNGSIAQYNATQQTGVVVTSGIVNPSAMAIDGYDNLWVENNFGNITAYSSGFLYGPPTNLVQTLSPAPPVYGIAVAGNVLAIGTGTSSGTSLSRALPALTTGTLQGTSFPTLSGYVMSAAGGSIYIGNLDGTIDIAGPQGSVASFITVPFTPTGIAADVARGRTYISNGAGDSIYVYGPDGALLHVIQ